MTPDSHALPIVPQIPVPDDVHAYLRFGAEFEPYEYTGWIDESMSWKETCYIGDWSPLFKMHLQGPDALAFFASLAGNDFDRFAIGQAKHLALPNARGKVMGDGILMRRGEDEFLFTSGPGALWTQWKFGRGGYDAVATDLTRDQFIFQVQGPASLQVLEQATQQSFRDIEFMRFAPREIDGMEFLALRQGMAGEVGYELHGRTEDGIAIWNRILEVGAAHGIRRLGGRTKMVNHVEACFPTPTVDYVPAWFDDDVRGFGDEMVAAIPILGKFFLNHSGSYEPERINDLFFSPVELGWGRNLTFEHDYLGRDALEAEVARPRRTMATLVWDADDVVDVYASLFRKGEPFQYMELPREQLGCVWADRVEEDGELAGLSTSRCYSYFFREMLSLCVLDVALAEPGTEVEVMWGNPGSPPKRIRATVARAPYKTDRRRADVSQLPAMTAR